MKLSRACSNCSYMVSLDTAQRSKQELTRRVISSLAGRPARHLWPQRVLSAKPASNCRGVAMSRELVAHNKPAFDQLHPRIYGTAVGLIAWFALMAWVLFDRSSASASR
jgi:hypothetical protein